MTTRYDIAEEVHDAMKSARLDDWERNFVESIARKPAHYVLSEKQEAVWRKLAEKIYATG